MNKEEKPFVGYRFVGEGLTKIYPPEMRAEIPGWLIYRPEDPDKAANITHYHKTWFQHWLIKKRLGQNPGTKRHLFNVLLSISFWFDDWRFGRPCCEEHDSVGI